MVMTHKTYYCVSTSNSRFPMDFNTSMRPKFIHVMHCRTISRDYLTGDIQLHASFIQRDGHMDDFVCFTNTVLTKYKKYAFTGNRPDFRLWLTNMQGEVVIVAGFILELMLEYREVFDPSLGMLCIRTDAERPKDPFGDPRPPRGRVLLRKPY